MLSVSCYFFSVRSKVYEDICLSIATCSVVACIKQVLKLLFAITVTGIRATAGPTTVPVINVDKLFSETSLIPL